MSAYRHLQRRTEAEVVELWEGCVKRWERAREAMRQLDELAVQVIEADRLRLFAAERETLAEGARLAKSLGTGETRAMNTPRLETVVEAVRREEQRLESRHRRALQLPYLPQLPDELDEDTAHVVYKQLTGVEATLSWLLDELANERKRHLGALAIRVSVKESRLAYQAKRDLAAIQKALAFESGKIDAAPSRRADRDIRVLVAPVALLVVIAGIVMVAAALYPSLVRAGPASQESDHLHCPSGCDLGKTRP